MKKLIVLNLDGEIETIYEREDYSEEELEDMENNGKEQEFLLCKESQETMSHFMGRCAKYKDENNI